MHAERSTFRLMLTATAAVAFGTRIDRLPKPIRRMMSLAARYVPPAARGRYVAEVRAVLERERVRRRAEQRVGEPER